MEMVIFSYVFLHFWAATFGQTISFIYELYSENEINGNSISSFDTRSLQACVALCDDTFGCLSVNFHTENGKCVVTDYYPPDNTRSGVQESGWKIYFRRHFDVDLLDGAVAWQTFYEDNGYSADKAIDGHTGVYNLPDCAHTFNGSSFWAVEFGTPGPVKKIEIYLRSDCCHSRNTNFRVTVSNTHDDAINDRGKLCGTYFGPAIDKEPFHLTITCANTIYGKFLKIKHEMDDFMTLCEVLVHTP